MKPVRVAALADIHLRTRTFARRAHFDGDAGQGLQYAADAILALDPLPDMVLLAGDVLNSRTMEQPCGGVLATFMSKLEFAGITQVLAIHGNHDRADRLAIESYGGINLGQHEGYGRSGVVVCGIPFDPSPERFHEKLASVPPCDILVIHQMLGELAGGAPTYDLTAEDIPAHVKACVCGHVHKGLVTRNKAGSTIVSPGCTAHTDLGGMMACPPSFAVLDIVPGAKGKVSAKIVPLPGRTALKLLLDDTHPLIILEDVLRSLPREHLNPVIIVDRDPALPRVDPANHPGIILIDRPRTVTGNAQADTLAEGADTIAAALELYAPGADDGDFRRFMLDLIEAGPKGARAVAESKLDEVCGGGWAANK